MSTTTTNYHLIKPSLSDVADITAMNANWDTIDGMLGVANSFTTKDITSGTDLNSLTDNSVYRCRTNSIANTLSNSPTTRAFSLIILPHTPTGCVQILTEYLTSGAKQFRRNKYQTTWGDWVEIATSEDLSALEERLDYAKYDDANPKQEIKATYIKDIAINDTTMTITKGNGTKYTQTTRDTTYSVATPDSSGLMSAADKAKLDRLREETSNVEIKQYTGTGTYGANGACSVTFSFAPKTVVMLATSLNQSSYGSSYSTVSRSGSSNIVVNTSSLSTSYVDKTGFYAYTSHNVSSYHYYAKKSADGKTLSWYLTIDGCSAEEHMIDGQFNTENAQYTVMAIR